MALYRIASDADGPRPSVAPRSSRAPRDGFGYELLVALIMAIAMTATVFLYR
jgi:hypothetical protein